MTSREKPAHRIAILASGRGSNMGALAQAVAQGRIEASIELVLSDVQGAPVLEAASRLGLKAVYRSPGEAPARFEPQAEAGYIQMLREHGITLVCLAGFMRILRPRFLEAFPQRILNVHPSLLPAFPGLHAVRQALEHGVRVTGATVHFVTPAVDGGPIVLQEAVAVETADTVESLERRVHAAEHRIFPEAAALYCADRLRLEGRHVRILPS